MGFIPTFGSSYSAKAASTALIFAPTSIFPSMRINGRRTNRGSLSIKDTISTSESALSANPSFFRLGLRQAKILDTPVLWANSSSSDSEKGSLK